MRKRDRIADLLKLADKVMSEFEDGGDCHFGLNGKRPFGNSGIAGDVIEIIGLEERDEDGETTEEGYAYACGLWAEMPDFLRRAWKRMRKEGGTG